MSEAPSEKHLEDWIVNNFDEFQSESSMYFELIARQTKLPSGKCDLIGIGETSTIPACAVCITEIKKGCIDEAALLQLLRYMSDVKSIWEYCLEGIPYLSGWDFSHLEQFNACGCLIGHSVTPGVIAAIDAVNVNVILYDYDDEYDVPYTFEYCSKNHTTLEQRCFGATGIIRDIVRRVHAQNLQQHMTQQEREERLREFGRSRLKNDFAKLMVGEA